MFFNEKINQIKISLFGNIWIVRLIKLLRYVGGLFLARLIWKSEHIFGKETPIQIFRSYVRDWSTKNVDTLLSVALTIGFFCFLLLVYFYLSGKLVEWLTEINIPASQQHHILQSKVYEVSKKTHYSVEKINDLEIIGYRGSSRVSLKGTLFLLWGKSSQKPKQIAFILYSHKQFLQDYLITNKFKDYWPQTNIHFSERTFFTWQKFLLGIFLISSVGFFLNRYWKGKQFPDTAIGDILSGENEARKKQAHEEEEKRKLAEERKKYIVDSQDIETTWSQIGGLKVAKEALQLNVELMKEKKKRKDFPIEPEHVLLYGPPGTGKTLLAQATAKASGAFFAYATGGQFAGKDRREREERINLFLSGVVKETKGEPCILFIDEFDRVNDGEAYEKGTEWNTVMDGIDKQKYPGVSIIAATNKAEQLDLSLLRSERFGKKLLITFPEKKELKDIIRTTLSMFYDHTQPGEPSLFSSSKESFVKEFTESIFKEITENKDYEIDPNELVGGREYDKETGKMKTVKVFDEEEVPPRPMFVGADIKKMIYKEASAIAYARGGKSLNQEDFKKAIRNTYEYNRSQGLQQKEMRKFLQEMLRIKGKDKDKMHIYW